MLSADRFGAEVGLTTTQLIERGLPAGVMFLHVLLYFTVPVVWLLEKGSCSSIGLSLLLLKTSLQW